MGFAPRKRAASCLRSVSFIVAKSTSTPVTPATAPAAAATSAERVARIGHEAVVSRTVTRTSPERSICTSPSMPACSSGRCNSGSSTRATAARTAAAETAGPDVLRDSRLMLAPPPRARGRHADGV